MRAPLSIVIPTLNAADELPATLDALFEGVSGGLVRELIVSDGGSDDTTLLIADEAGAVVLSGAPSRGGQLRRGVAAARGDWLLLVHADTHLSPGWTDIVRASIAQGQAGFFRLRFRHEGQAARLIAGWANLRSRWFGLPYGDQGLLIRARDLEAAGGVPDVPLMEDVALARALRGQLAPLSAVAATSFERYARGGWLRRGARNLSLLARYLAGADPNRLARAYRR